MITEKMPLENESQPSCLTAVSGSVLMNILEENYDLNIQFHKEVREMIFSFAVSHYGEKLTLEAWLLKHYR
jgi:hypothetical protein